MDQIGRNVAKAVKLPKVVRTEKVCLDAAQAKAFLKEAEADRLSAMYALALDGGLRPGELFALHWSDLDLAGASVFVHRSLEEISGKCRLKQTKTAAGKRRVLISTRTAARLGEHRARMLAEGKDVKEGLVFCGPEGGFLRKSDVRRLSFMKIRKRAGLSDKLRLYDLRHTSATLLLWLKH
jgi:integrase